MDSARVVLFCGTDEFLAGKAAREYVDKRCPPEEAAFGLEVVEGACDSGEAAAGAVRRCLDGLRTVGFFGTGKVVWLRDISFFRSGDAAKGDEIKGALKELVEEVDAGLPEGVCLVLSAGEVDGRSAVVKAVKEKGVIREFNIPDKGYKVDGYAREFVAERLKEAGLRGQGEVAGLIVERAGPDSRLLAQEVDKLRVYVGTRDTVTAADVAAIVSPGRERAAWDLADAFMNRNLVEALGVARSLQFMGVHGVALVINLQYRIRELLVLKICLEKGWLRLGGSPGWAKAEWSVRGEEAEEFLGAMSPDPRKANPFASGRKAEAAKGFKVATLQRCEALAVTTHEQMLSGAAPADLLLERMLILMLGGARKR
ncbi:MAG TPA: hypothetical protein PKE55_05335 [Kiritimatiellia bacterium]|nr:hypothetical protein [Kiritimatiellia bacterium]